jgi:hypothetical protein
MPLIAFEISLTVCAPFLTQSTAPTQYGVDAILARDHAGRFYLPGTLVTGKLREAWGELKDLDAGFGNIIACLGDKSGDKEENPSVAPSRKRLFIGDLRAQAHERDYRNPAIRIQMDAQRGAVRKNALQVIEKPFAAGEEIEFKGIAHFLAHTEEEAEQLKRRLEAGLKWLTQLGAHRSIGYGRLSQVNLSQTGLEPVIKPASLAPDATGCDLLVRPQAPFCVAERRIAENLFESAEIIPGGALKGAVAGMWADLLGKKLPVTPDFDTAHPLLSTHFEKLRITHAFPCRDGERPVKAPLSLVKAKDSLLDVAAPLSLVKAKDSLLDVALHDKPVLLHGQAPAFSVDWKTDSDARKAFGWPALKRELRVRTAIDTDKRRAKDEELFAYEMIVPGDTTWHAQLDLSDIPAEDRAGTLAEWQDLLQYGLTGLGKSKTYTLVECRAGGTVKPRLPSNPALKDGLWIVTLQTPALLRAPPETHSAGALLDAYRRAWADLSKNTLELSHFYASQSLAGGFYLWRRFQPDKPYQPYLLTDAGSVFVLKAKTAEAGQRIQTWLARGLPLPTWAKQEYGDNWNTCPYPRQAGYGEIAVNLDVHWDWKTEAVEEITP